METPEPVLAGGEGGIRAPVLVGPTACGKSAVAQWLARERGWTVLNADSRLVYRRMDIGTAKPTPAERGAVRHEGMDLAAPDCRFSVWDFRNAACAALRAAAREGRTVLVAGGTGLYVKSLTHGLDAASAPDPAQRAHWESVLAAGGPEALADALRARDPEALARLSDPRNPRRLIRALETGGAPGSVAPHTWRESPGPVLAGLRRNADDLKSRIETRVRDMYLHDFAEEVRSLLEADGGLPEAARTAIGYAEAADWLAGRCGREEAVAATVLRTRRLAKRQMTWFRHQARVLWFDVAPDESPRMTGERLLKHWEEHGFAELAGVPACVRCRPGSVSN